jgi:hypothetical protein
MTEVNLRPFKLLGHKIARLIYDERVLYEADSDDLALDLVIVPGKAPVVSTHVVEEQKVLELSMTIAIVKKGAIDRSEIGDGETCFGKDSVIAVKMHAGYIARNKSDEEKLEKFQDMMVAACEQLYQATRAQVVSLAANSAFDASDIPTEFDTIASFANSN